MGRGIGIVCHGYFGMPRMDRIRQPVVPLAPTPALPPRRGGGPYAYPRDPPPLPPLAGKVGMGARLSAHISIAYSRCGAMTRPLLPSPGLASTMPAIGAPGYLPASAKTRSPDRRRRVPPDFPSWPVACLGSQLNAYFGDKTGHPVSIEWTIRGTRGIKIHWLICTRGSGAEFGSCQWTSTRKQCFQHAMQGCGNHLTTSSVMREIRPLQSIKNQLGEDREHGAEPYFRRRHSGCIDRHCRL